MTYYHYLARVMKSKSIKGCAQAVFDSCHDPDVSPSDSDQIYKFAQEHLLALLSTDFIRLQKGE